MPRLNAKYLRCKLKSSMTCRNCVPKSALGWRSLETGSQYFKTHLRITMPCFRLCASSLGAASRHSKPMLPWLPPLGSPLHRPHRPHRPSATSRLLRLFLRSVASRFTAPLLLLIPLSPLRDHRHQIGIPPRLKVCLYAIITISANQATAPGPILRASSSQSGVVSRPPSRAPSRAPSAGGGSQGGSRPRT